MKFPKPERKVKAKHTNLGRSAKRDDQMFLYRNAIRPAYLSGLAAGQGRRDQRPLCERCLAKLGPYARTELVPLATEVHHMAGRSGSRLIDDKNLAGLCRACHEFVETNRQAAIAEGWSRLRLGAGEGAEEGEDVAAEGGASDSDEGEDAVDDLD